MAKAVKKRKGGRVTDAEAEQMFKYYARLHAEGKGGQREVARKFGRPDATVSRVASKYGWKARLSGIAQEVQKKTDKAIERSHMSNARLAVAVRNKAVSNFLTKAKESDTSASDCVRILDYCDRIGAGGEGEGPGSVNGSPEAIDAALRIIRTLGEKGLKALGDWIVKSGAGEEIEREATAGA